MAIQYKTPHKYEDSDIWFKFFTKSDLAILALPAFVDFNIIFNHFLGNSIEWYFWAILVIVITAPFVLYTKASVPKSRPLYGGGIKLKKIGKRAIMYYVFKQGRTIYVKDYDKNWRKPNK